MTRFIAFSIALALCACASELHTSSSLDQSSQKADVGHAEEHAQASDLKSAKADEKTVEAVKDERNEGPVTTDDELTVAIAATPTSPAKTITRKRHTVKGAIETKHDGQRTDSVRRTMTDDAKAIFDGSSDTSSRSLDTTKKNDQVVKKSKPSLGFLAAVTPYLFAAGAVLALLAFAWLTHGNPVALAGKVLAWLVAKVRGQPSAS